MISRSVSSTFLLCMQHPFITCMCCFHTTSHALYQSLSTICTALDFLQIGFLNMLLQDRNIYTSFWSSSRARVLLRCIHLHHENRFVHPVIAFLSSFVYPGRHFMSKYLCKVSLMKGNNRKPLEEPPYGYANQQVRFSECLDLPL